MENTKDWKTRTLILGAVAGLLIGVGSAYMYIKKADEMEVKPKITTGDGMKLGVGLVNLLKTITELGH